jgi:hypothetical protein
MEGPQEQATSPPTQLDLHGASYQRKLREEEHAQALAQSFRERVGNHDFEKVVEFKEWLVRHPKRASIFSYLVHDLPPAGE